MTTTVRVDHDLLARRRAEAEAFRREHVARGTLVIQLLSSPGAGKTTLLEATARHWGAARRLGVLVGDIETDRDRDRLAPLVPTVQITTGGACHLDLSLVRRGLDRLGDRPLDFLFIEDVGNLVCPASHDVGQHLRVVLLSVPEGDDKPAKYPRAFRTSQALVVTKTDLLPHVPFRVEAAATDARLIRPDLEVLALCARTGEGLVAWCALLDRRRQALLAPPA